MLYHLPRSAIVEARAHYVAARSAARPAILLPHADDVVPIGGANVNERFDLAVEEVFPPLACETAVRPGERTRPRHPDQRTGHVRTRPRDLRDEEHRRREAQSLQKPRDCQPLPQRHCSTPFIEERDSSAPTRCTTGLSMMGYKARRIPQIDYLCIPGGYGRMRTSENSVKTKFAEFTF